MHDLGRLVARGIKGKEPLPMPFRSWKERGMLIYPGSVTLIAGMAGTYKSMVASNLVAAMGQPSLVFSNDTDDLTVAARLLGMATGSSVDQCRIAAVHQPEQASAILRKRYGHIKWAFSPDPSLDDIWLHTHAWAERYGDWPRVITIDIASNVGIDHGSYDEWGALRELMRQSNVLARETGAAVIAVHHCAEGAKTTDTFPCPSRGDVMGKISALPVLMVTLGKDSRGDLHAACVKARNAASDATGRSSFRMHVDPSTGRVQDYDPHLHQRATYAPRVASWEGGWEADSHE